jgi:hypothetical protein
MQVFRKCARVSLIVFFVFTNLVMGINLGGADQSGLGFSSLVPTVEAAPAAAPPPTCPPAVINGVITSGSPDYPFVTGTQTSRLFRNAVESSCGTAKPVPNLTDNGVTFKYDAYSFTNPTFLPICITITTVAGGANQILTAAYLDSFNPFDVQENYVGDAGNSDKTRSFSFIVPRRESFIVVQSRVNNAANPTSLAYSFRVLGLPGCDSCPPTDISGTIGSGSPDYPAAIANQNDRLFRDSVAPTCDAPKPVPNLTDEGLTFKYDAYTFLNTSFSPRCITVTTTAGANNQLLTVAYLDRFNPFDVQENYLGDAGNSSLSRTFSFTVPGRRSFVIVQHRVNNALNPPSLAYTFRVLGLPGCDSCPPTDISGTIGSGSPDYPAAIANQTSRLFRNNGVPSCDTAKPFPGLTDEGIQFKYDAYTFFNTSASPVCITVTTTAGAPNQIFTVAYLDSFNPFDVQEK